MRFRVAIQSDAQAIASLHAASWRIAYRGLLSDEYLDGNVVSERTAMWEESFRTPSNNQYVVVAEVGPQIVGFACAYGDDDPHWGTLLDNLHVDDKQKRQRVGARLMAHVAAWCSSAYPNNGLYLWVLKPNVSARRFYEHLNGVNVGEDVWFPPGGGEIPKLRYAWRHLDVLL